MRLAVAVPRARTTLRIPIARRDPGPGTITTLEMVGTELGGQWRLAWFGAAHRSSQRHSGTSVRGLIRELAKPWSGGRESAIAPDGISLFQHRKRLEFFGPPATQNSARS